MHQTQQNELVVLGAVMLLPFRSYDIGGSFCDALVVKSRFVSTPADVLDARLAVR